MQKSLNGLVTVQMAKKNFRFLRVLAKDFWLMIDNNQEESLYVVSDRFDLCIKLRAGGYIPKSGFFLIDSLKSLSLTDKSVLDIGCGETGIISHYLYSRGAASVVGIDIDPVSITHVKYSSNVSNRITWVLGDLYDSIEDKFDLIVSNPPQMPMSLKNRSHLNDWHDSSGDTGRETIIRILSGAMPHLKPRGSIFMLIFDFLGIKQSFNTLPSIEEIGRKYGFSCEIVRSYMKVIRKGGQTEKNISWIRHIYPQYNFEVNSNDDFFCNILVVKFQCY